MPDIPTTEPTEITAGDTIAWTKDLPDYSAATYTLKYELRGPSSITITASASGTTHSVSVTAAVSATWAPGVYSWKSVVTAGSTRYTVAEGRIEILPDWQASNGSREIRTWAEITLDLYEQLIQQRASRPELGYTIMGRSFNFKSDKELWEARNQMKQICMLENPDTSAAAQIIKMKFKAP